jgi:hypothetical protein
MLGTTPVQHWYHLEVSFCKKRLWSCDRCHVITDFVHICKATLNANSSIISVLECSNYRTFSKIHMTNIFSDSFLYMPALLYTFQDQTFLPRFYSSFFSIFLLLNPVSSQNQHPKFLATTKTTFQNV